MGVTVWWYGGVTVSSPPSAALQQGKSWTRAWRQCNQALAKRTRLHACGGSHREGASACSQARIHGTWEAVCAPHHRSTSATQAAALPGPPARNAEEAAHAEDPPSQRNAGTERPTQHETPQAGAQHHKHTQVSNAIAGHERNRKHAKLVPFEGRRDAEHTVKGA